MHETMRYKTDCSRIRPSSLFLPQPLHNHRMMTTPVRYVQLSSVDIAGQSDADAVDQVIDST